MTSVSAGHIILTLTQPVGSGRPQRGSNPGPPHQELRALPIVHSKPELYETILSRSRFYNYYSLAIPRTIETIVGSADGVDFFLPKVVQCATNSHYKRRTDNRSNLEPEKLNVTANTIYGGIFKDVGIRGSPSFSVDKFDCISTKIVQFYC